MTNKHLVLAIVIGAVVVAVSAFGFYTIDLALNQKAQNLGAANVTPYYAMNSQALTNELNAIANPLTGWLATSTTLNALTVGSTTVQSTTLTVTGVTAGDYIEWGLSTSTTNVMISCQSFAANTVNCTEFSAVPGSAGISAATTTLYIVDIPRTTFVSPAIL